MKKDKLLDILSQRIIDCEEKMDNTPSVYMEGFFLGRVESYKEFLFDLELLDE